MKLKKVSKTPKRDEKSLKKAYKKPKKGKYHRGIVLLHHIPHGFYEKEMKSYFSQFGKVMRLRLARSRKTGKSKGYAFVEFEFEEVAKIVAETMNNYLMFERLIKSTLLPHDVSGKKIFKSSYIKEDHYPKLIARKYVKAKQDEVQTEKEMKQDLESRTKKLQEQNEKLLALGINYQYNSDEESDSEIEEAETDIKSEEESNSDSISNEEEIPPKTVVKKSLDESLKKKSPAAKTKYSPKNLRSRADKSISKPETVVEKKETKQTFVAEKKAKDEKLEKLKNSKISPKVLRSRKSEVSFSALTSQAAKLFDSKVSPKVFRKRKSDLPPRREENTEEEKLEFLPKVSPKFLRSKARKSEGPIKEPPTPVTPKAKRGRKSVF